MKYYLARIYRLFFPKYTCAVCNKHVFAYIPLDDKFKDEAEKYGFKYYGQGETINTLKYYCPNCKSSDRERLYALYLTETFNKLAKQEKYTFLDIAPSSTLSDSFFNKFPYIKRRTADLMMDNVDDKIDISDMKPYKTNTFDFFLCSHVLEHVEEPDKAMRELFRVLKVGGQGIVMVPIIPVVNETLENHSHTTEAERWKYYGQGDHLRLFGKQDFVKRLENAGFNVQQLGIDFFGKRKFTENGLKESSVLYVVKKNHD